MNKNREGRMVYEPNSVKHIWNKKYTLPNSLALNINEIQN